MSERTDGTAVVARGRMVVMGKVYLTPPSQKPADDAHRATRMTGRIDTISAIQTRFHAAAVGREALRVGQRLDVGSQRGEVGLGQPDHAPSTKEFVG